MSGLSMIGARASGFFQVCTEETKWFSDINTTTNVLLRKFPTQIYSHCEKRLRHDMDKININSQPHVWIGCTTSKKPQVMFIQQHSVRVQQMCTGSQRMSTDTGCWLEIYERNQ